MTFKPDQVALLTAPLNAANVKQREQGGTKLSYIEGWHAIAEANRIFGFDAWDRETVDLRMVWEGKRQTRSGEKPAAAYLARVRITVRTKEGKVTREGVGTGTGFGTDVGEAHESAAKEAETDAMKRALMTFGNPFGLALYDKTQANVVKDEPAPAPKAEPKAKPSLFERAEKLEAALKATKSVDELNKAWALGSALCAELDTAEPELLVGLENTFKFMDIAHSQKEAA